MSEKKTKNVLPATEPTPTESHGVTDEAPLVRDDSVSKSNEAKPEPFQLIPPFKISGKAKGMAKAAGVDLQGVEEMAPRINDWASSVELRLNAIIGAIPNIPLETVKILKAEAEKQRAEMMQRTQMPTAGAPAQGGDLISVLAQVAPMLLGGSSGGISDEITKQVIDAGIKQMFAGTRLLEAIQTKIMTDMGVKAVTETISK